MAFCPRSAQKIFWWLKSASRATVLRSWSTICVYSRLSSPSFRMSLRFVKIRQGSLPAMQEMELKVWPDGISIHVAYECSSPTKVCLVCLPYECVHVHQLDLANESALVINWLQAKNNHQQCVISRKLTQWIPRSLGSSVDQWFIISSSTQHNLTYLLLYTLLYWSSSDNLHDTRICSLLSSWCKSDYRFQDSNTHWYLQGRKRMLKHLQDKAATEHYSNCMNGILEILYNSFK